MFGGSHRKTISRVYIFLSIKLFANFRRDIYGISKYSLQFKIFLPPRKTFIKVLLKSQRLLQICRFFDGMLTICQISCCGHYSNTNLFGSFVLLFLRIFLLINVHRIIQISYFTLFNIRFDTLWYFFFQYLGGGLINTMFDTIHNNNQCKLCKQCVFCDTCVFTSLHYYCLYVLTEQLKNKN